MKNFLMSSQNYLFESAYSRKESLGTLEKILALHRWCNGASKFNGFGAAVHKFPIPWKPQGNWKNLAEPTWKERLGSTVSNS